MNIVNGRGPVLQAKTRTGKAKFWQAWYEVSAKGVNIITAWWQEGSVVQNSVPEVVEGKNLGKTNETTPEQQAKLQLLSMYKHQIDKGYTDGITVHDFVLPMLAQDYYKRGHSIVFPCAVQPKLDGFRMLMDGEKAWTRGGKLHILECVKHLIFDTKGVILDGELLLPGNKPLQETSTAAKKYRPGVSDTLEYHVYDAVLPGCCFRERLVRLRDILKKVPPKVHLVNTQLLKDSTEIQGCHDNVVAQGYEGIMLRNLEGKYQIGHRSTDLQKVKAFMDSEFVVVDIVEGKGSFTGHAIVVCQTEQGQQFSVTPKGPMEWRKQLYDQRTKFIGNQYTVKYQSLSNEGIPIFPIGINFRSNGD